MPLFTYTEDIPFEDNDPSTDQPDMKQNTNSIADILDVDMIGFGNVNGGNHSRVTFVDQGSDPGSAATKLVLYSKSQASGSELFYQRDGVATPIQLTRNTTGTNANGSYSYLAGGFLIQWGSVTAVNNSATVTFPLAFTAAPTSFTATVRNLAGIYGVASVQVPTASGAVINSSIINQVIYWMAIGV